MEMLARARCLPGLSMHFHLHLCCEGDKEESDERPSDERPTNGAAGCPVLKVKQSINTILTILSRQINIDICTFTPPTISTPLSSPPFFSSLDVRIVNYCMYMYVQYCTVR